MLNDRPSILTLEIDGIVVEEAKVFGWEEALRVAAKMKDDNGLDPDDPVCFIYIESEMNFKNFK